MKQINDNPVRYELSSTIVKRVLFSKKEITVCALGDENGQPMTEYLYDCISEFKDGVAEARLSGKIISHLLLTDGSQLVPELTKKYRVSMLPNGYISLAMSTKSPRGIATRDGKVLLNPASNIYMDVDAEGDTVIFGKYFPDLPTEAKLGVSVLEDGTLREVIPRKYNFIQRLGKHVFALGRTVDTGTATEMVSLTKNRVTTTYRSAYAIFSIDSGLLTQKVFGEFQAIPNGFKAVYYPHIQFDQLSHSQSMGEAFWGTGKLDFRGAKIVTLDENFNITT